jgi:type IV secretory pathway VirB2 component (pilin)
MTQLARHLCMTTLAAAAARVRTAPSAGPIASAGLPWDQPLDTLVGYMTGPIVHLLIVGSLIGAGIFYALGGSGSGARRLARAGLGSALALGTVRLLNYLLPY